MRPSEWIWVPLDRSDIPPVDSAAELLHQMNHINSILGDGARVLIHCSAGIHRTGMFAYALLCQLGQDRDTARHTLELLRSVTAQGVGDERLEWGDQLNESTRRGSI